MKPYLLKKKSVFGNDKFVKVKNIPNSKQRKKYLRDYDMNDRTEIQLRTETTRTAVKRQWKREVQSELTADWEMDLSL